MSDISSHWLTYFMMICKTRSGSADGFVFSSRWFCLLFSLVKTKSLGLVGFVSGFFAQ
jgi:hypothetical protein